MLEYFRDNEQLEAYIKGAIVRERIDILMRQKPINPSPRVKYALIVKTVATIPKAGRRLRKRIPDEGRAAVLERDGYRCAECGSEDNIQIHHIIYRSKGGADTIDNLKCLCAECHYKKHRDEPVGRIMKKRLNRS